MTDYISLTDMLKAKDGEFFHFGLAQEPQHGRVLGDLASPSTTPLLITANSPQLEVGRGRIHEQGQEVHGADGRRIDF